MTAVLTLSALTALTAILVMVAPSSRTSPPALIESSQQPSTRGLTASSVPVDGVAGFLSNAHGAPQTSAGSLPASAPGLRPEMQEAYSLAFSSAPPSCRLPLNLLAAIGQVESRNLAGHHVQDGRAVPALVGPALDGDDRPAVPDTDAGQLDQDRSWDRALGSMQLVPAVWRVAGVDMDGDGRRDPQNIFDAAGAAMVYLCADGRDLSRPSDVEAAVLSYEGTRSYLRLVIAWKAAYDHRDQMLDQAAGFGPYASYALRARRQGAQTRRALVVAALRALSSRTTDVRPAQAARPRTTEPWVPHSSPSPLPNHVARPAEDPSSVVSSAPESAPGSPTPHPVVSRPSPGPRQPVPPAAAPRPTPRPQPELDPRQTPEPRPSPDPAPTCTPPAPVDVTPGVLTPVLPTPENPAAIPTDGSVLCGPQTPEASPPVVLVEGAPPP